MSILFFDRYGFKTEKENKKRKQTRTEHVYLVASIYIYHGDQKKHGLKWRIQKCKSKANKFNRKMI